MSTPDRFSYASFHYFARLYHLAIDLVRKAVQRWPMRTKWRKRKRRWRKRSRKRRRRNRTKNWRRRKKKRKVEKE